MAGTALSFAVCTTTDFNRIPMTAKASRRSSYIVVSQQSCLSGERFYVLER